MSTKVHVLADAQGRPVHVMLGAGQQPDCTRALDLLQGVSKTGNVLADQAYDTNQVLAAVAALGAEAIIPSQPRRRVARPVDLDCYRQRNRIERLLSRLKQFRRLATRYDKTASSYLGFVHFVCALLWLRYANCPYNLAPPGRLPPSSAYCTTPSGSKVGGSGG